MPERAYDGHPLQAGTAVDDYALTGQRAHFAISGLREMVVVSRAYSDQPGNRSRRYVEYTCRDVHTSELFPGCRRLSQMGGVLNGDDDVLHPTTTLLTGATAAAGGVDPQHAPALTVDGDQVMVGFVDGSRSRPVIIGVFQHSGMTYGAKAVNGERRLTRHAGTSIEIQADGTYVVTHKSGSVMKFLSNGDVQVTPAGNLVLAGAETAGPTSEGIVPGTGIDPFTGATYNQLGNASARVFAKK